MELKKRTRIGAYALVRSGEGILLVKQALGPNKGLWGLPGGGVDFLEDPKSALVRELFEECRLKVGKAQLELTEVLSTESLWTDPGLEPEQLHWIGIVYELNEAQPGEFMEKVELDGDSESADCARWFKPDELIKEKLSKLFAEYLLGI